MQLERIAKRYDIDMQLRETPSDDAVEKIVAERVTALLESRLRDRDKLKTERSQRFIELARELAHNEEESPLIAMLVDDFYQQVLHEPLVVKPPEIAEPVSDSKPKNKKSRHRPRKTKS
jgi:ATP-dependent RNA helicase DeaD